MLRLKRPGEAGFTLVEMALAGTIGLLALSMGFMLFRAQTAMSTRQEDVNDAQLTIDYTAALVRTLAVSAGGGLPQMANGIRRHQDGRGFVTYYNPLDASTAVPADLNLDSADGRIPVNDASILPGSGYAFITRDEEKILAPILSVDVAAGILTVAAAAESTLGGADFVYPVEYCSLFVDGGGYLRKTFVGRTGGYADIPLAAGIDSLQISYDLSAAGNGAFGASLDDSSRVSRVKVFLRVLGPRAGAGRAKRTYETVIGIRRGRLYNRAI